jgi:signal transduction histidine kinase
VRDNGIGFETQYAQQIFGVFKRLHSEKYPGTGIGLAICKWIVEGHRASIWPLARPVKAQRSFSLCTEDRNSRERQVHYEAPRSTPLLEREGGTKQAANWHQPHSKPLNTIVDFFPLALDGHGSTLSRKISGEWPYRSVTRGPLP